MPRSGVPDCAYKLLACDLTTFRCATLGMPPLQNCFCATGVDFIPIVRNSITRTQTGCIFRYETTPRADKLSPEEEGFYSPSPSAQGVVKRNLNDRNITNRTRWNSIGQSWQQGPLSTGAIRTIFRPEPPQKRLYIWSPTASASYSLCNSTLVARSRSVRG